jgi:hypothetical protein
MCRAMHTKEGAKTNRSGSALLLAWNFIFQNQLTGHRLLVGKMKPTHQSSRTGERPGFGQVPRAGLVGGERHAARAGQKAGGLGAFLSGRSRARVVVGIGEVMQVFQAETPLPVYTAAREARADGHEWRGLP